MRLRIDVLVWVLVAVSCYAGLRMNGGLTQSNSPFKAASGCPQISMTGLELFILSPRLGLVSVGGDNRQPGGMPKAHRRCRE